MMMFIILLSVYQDNVACAFFNIFCFKYIGVTLFQTKRESTLHGQETHNNMCFCENLKDVVKHME